RLDNPWPYPDLILIDGGKGQVNVAKSVLDEFGLSLSVVGIAKGVGRKKNEFVGYKPTEEEKKVLVKVRDEAHRFAISYHKKLRNRSFWG
ncbi:MAG: excinuclease ABC subunit C, partial [Candidatus Colwellbacteria bacterium]|nr:excinuclease ABC subunit C [Candidatus Colwellbacteria bacterium]